jgi:hypothetical protein
MPQQDSSCEAVLNLVHCRHTTILRHPQQGAAKTLPMNSTPSGKVLLKLDDRDKIELAKTYNICGEYWNI